MSDKERGSEGVKEIDPGSRERREERGQENIGLKGELYCT
jgi:hypothetical protein